MSNTEIERKFLLDRLPEDIEQKPHNIIRQGYIVTDSSNEVRVRAKGSDYYLTIKQGNGLTRDEVEIPISEHQFNALWGLTAGKRVEKTRYDYADSGSLIEIDVYSGGLTPLKVAEVEFTSVDASRGYTIPSFFGREVTQDKSFKNASLAVKGMPDSYTKELK